MLTNQEKRARELSKAVAALGYKPKKKVASKAPKVFNFSNISLKERPDDSAMLVRRSASDAQKAARDAAELADTVSALYERVMKAEASASLSASIAVSHSKTIESLTKEPIKVPEPKEIVKETIIQKEAEPLTITEEHVKEIVRLMQKLPENHKLEVQGIRNFQSFVYKGTKYGMEEMMHGGGASSSSGTTVTFETPTGTVDDSNMSFTVSHTPLYIVINGSQYTVGNGLFATYAAGTITLSSPVGTGGFIQSAYNA